MLELVLGGDDKRVNVVGAAGLRHPQVALGVKPQSHAARQRAVGGVVLSHHGVVLHLAHSRSSAAAVEVGVRLVGRNDDAHVGRVVGVSHWGDISPVDSIIGVDLGFSTAVGTREDAVVAGAAQEHSLLSGVVGGPIGVGADADAIRHEVITRNATHHMCQTFSTQHPPVAFFLAGVELAVSGIHLGIGEAGGSNGIVVVLGTKACHKSCGIGLHCHWLCTHHLLEGEVAGVDAQAIGAMTYCDNLESGTAREEELAVVDGIDETVALGVGCLLVMSCELKLLVGTAVVELAGKAHHLDVAHLGNRGDTHVIVSHLLDVEGGVVEHQIAKGGGYINLSWSKSDVVDGLDLVKHHILDGRHINDLSTG